MPCDPYLTFLLPLFVISQIMVPGTWILIMFSVDRGLMLCDMNGVNSSLERISLMVNILENTQREGIADISQFWHFVCICIHLNNCQFKYAYILTVRTKYQTFLLEKFQLRSDFAIIIIDLRKWVLGKFAVPTEICPIILFSLYLLKSYYIYMYF